MLTSEAVIFPNIGTVAVTSPLPETQVLATGKTQMNHPKSALICVLVWNYEAYWKPQPFIQYSVI